MLMTNEQHLHLHESYALSYLHISVTVCMYTWYSSFIPSAYTENSHEKKNHISSITMDTDPGSYLSSNQTHPKKKPKESRQVAGGLALGVWPPCMSPVRSRSHATTRRVWCRPVGFGHRRAGSLTVDHDRDAAAVAWPGRGRIEFGAADGARGVRTEPGVDARRVERVAADG